MNDALLKLLRLKNKLNHAGWITLVPCSGDELVIRVAWHLDQLYGYERRFTSTELKSLNADLANNFIDDANLEIERIVNNTK